MSIMAPAGDITVTYVTKVQDFNYFYIKSCYLTTQRKLLVEGKSKGESPLPRSAIAQTASPVTWVT